MSFVGVLPRKPGEGADHVSGDFFLGILRVVIDDRPTTTLRLSHSPRIPTLCTDA